MPDPPFLTFKAVNRSPRVIPRSRSVAPDYFSPSRPDQGKRLVPKLGKLEEALAHKSFKLHMDALGYLAEEILVLEIAGGLEDFLETLREVEGFEWLGDEQVDFHPEEDGFRKKDPKKQSDSIGGLLYLFATNLPALQQLKSAWQQKAEGNGLSGITSKLGKILDRVINIRGWDWRDRLRDADLDYWKEEIADGASMIRFEAELWFRKESGKRHGDQMRLKQKAEQLGGTVLSTFEHTPSGYSGALIELPAENALSLIVDPAGNELFQESSIYHFWPVGQASQPGDNEAGTPLPENFRDLNSPSGSPTVALYDGLPVANHPLLAGRLEIDDPDNLESNYLVTKRAHGTHMASLICLGDLSTPKPALTRPLYVRPIMQALPNAAAESIPQTFRPNDLLERAVHRMKSGDGDEQPTAPDVHVINLSVGDMGRIYDGHAPSSWARMIDWLQWKYQVLFIISAGNCSQVPVGISLSDLEKLSPEELEKAFIEFRIAEARQLRLLSPAESINALTVGSHHSDETGPVTLNSIQLMPIRHPDMPSPSSRNGPGFLRSVKPDILMPGGRQPVSVIGDRANCYVGHLAPGQKVAAPPSPGQPGPATKFIRGTSGATALATRQAAILIEQLSEMATPPPPSHTAVIVKALLTHGASRSDTDTHLRSLFNPPARQHVKWKGGTVSPLVGHGRINEELFNSIEGHRATVLGWDTISADESLEFRYPIPPSLGDEKGKKRFTVTLAYFSPINPHNRKYRTARLSFKFPESVDNFLGGTGRKDVDDKQGCKGTVQHEIYEGSTLRGIVDDEFVIKVECREEGGKIDNPIPFALAVTLEGASEIFPHIRPEIAEHLRNVIPTPLRPRRVPV